MRRALRDRSISISLLAVAAACGGSDAGGSDHAFERIACPDQAPDPLADRLCAEAADPEAATEDIFIACDIETACFAPEDPSEPPPDSVIVMAYNMERGFYLDQQLALFADGTIPTPDVLLISEADRGCSRTDGRNVTRELAEALEMDYAFATEFIELPRNTTEPVDQIDAICEHGNAVLSRFPIGNVEAIRHTENESWRDVEDQPRLGGRVAVKADIQVGSRYLHVYALHFESGLLEDDYREAQAIELIEHAAELPFSVVIGGDTNAVTYHLSVGEDTTDRTVRAFLDRDYIDTHQGLAPEERPTTPAGGGAVIDLLFTRDDSASAPGLCPVDTCATLSDHVPVWATVEL